MFCVNISYFSLTVKAAKGTNFNTEIEEILNATYTVGLMKPYTGANCQHINSVMPVC